MSLEHYLNQLKQVAREQGLPMQSPGCKLSGEAGAIHSNVAPAKTDRHR